MSKRLCFECESYKELSDGYGYCVEWDTVVSLSDICITHIETEFSINKERENSNGKAKN